MGIAKKEISFEVDNAALATVQNAVINANFDEVKEALTEMLAPYKAQVVTEETIREAKNDKAKINKVIKNLESYRKSVKNSVLQPYTLFEEKCKALTGMCKEAVDNIDSQIKVFDDREKEQKISALNTYFYAQPNEFPEYATWDAVYKKAWENKSYRASDARADIDNFIRQTALDVKVLMTINQKWQSYLLAEYKANHDLNACLAINERYKKAEEEEAKRQSLAEQQREIEKALEEFEVTPLDAPKATSKPVPKVPEMVTPRHQEDELLNIQFSVTATEEQLNQLQAFMDGHGIMWKVM